MACPSAADTRGPSGVPTVGVRTAGTEAPGPEGELRSLAELEDVKDGDERDESDDVTESKIESVSGLNVCPMPHWFVFQ